LVITHHDRLWRFGAELVFAICEAKSVAVVILNAMMIAHKIGLDPTNKQATYFARASGVARFAYN
jgi:hypothetical protein